MYHWKSLWNDAFNFTFLCKQNTISNLDIHIINCIKSLIITLKFLILLGPVLLYPILEVLLIMADKDSENYNEIPLKFC